MKNKIHLLRRYIREAIDLGDVQFSPVRKDGVRTDEPNTPDEENLYKKLSSRVRGVGNVDADTAAKLAALINSEKYGVRGSGFFAGPDNKDQVLYRGDAFDTVWAEEYVGANLDEAMGGKMKLIKPYWFGLNEDEESFRGWTTDIDTAWHFAKSYAYDSKSSSASWPPTPTSDLLAVVLCMYPRDNDPDSLIDFSKSVYATEVGKRFMDEKEVLNVKPVVCYEAFVFNPYAMPRRNED